MIKRLDESVDHVLVHTGQNYDHQLNQVFFDDLGSLPRFKTEYRSRLDGLGAGLDERERQRMIGEVRLAYQLNAEVLAELRDVVKAAA